MKKKSSNFITVLLVLILLVGLSLLLYPSVSDYWNSFTQSQVIVDYAKQIAELDEDRYLAYLNDAVAYNRSLLDRKNHYLLTEDQKAEYDSLLNLTGLGIMGYIEIPSIRCTLPIYHGTGEAVLSMAVGHLDWTSLPVGGESTHCVLSGHRGLPSAKLFTDLDKIVVGDVFLIRVLDETLTYEVDQIRIVDPDDLSNLGIEEGEDLFTLVTCTPYGINTHRLLVRGHRIATIDMDYIKVVADATQIDPVTVAPALAIPMLIVLLIWMLIRYRKEKRRIKIA